jgi:cellulose synthase/poly-beta-1,6-N-acetylglucosamine synthase-like glycosyltransferase
MVDGYAILVYILFYIGLVATVFYIINYFTYYRKKKDPPEATDKTVTILIPAYNEEKSIDKTIESALAIDYPKNKIEIIVINDGSKDRTYGIAKKLASKYSRVRVFTKENGGKGSALNLGLKKAKGEIVVSMDADTFVKPDALKKMVGYFREKRVMSVSPSMALYKPKSIWARAVQIEYFLGVFLRKSFATVNAIHVTPGAFSAYRKSFFDKYGGYDEGNLTEDLEVALRIQDKGYVIENAPEAVARTVSPESFKGLLMQRRRWYTGLVRNLWAYRRLFGFKHGALGGVILPTAVVTVFISVILTVYMVIKAILQVRLDLLSLSSINFKFYNAVELSSFMLEKVALTILSYPVFVMLIMFTILLGFYIAFSRRKMKYKESVAFNFVLFLIFFSLLFSFWWIVSFTYSIFGGRVKWK